MMRRLFQILVLALLPLPAAAQSALPTSIAWTGPQAGQTFVFDGRMGEMQMEVVQRILAVEGDEIVLESQLSPTPERYFRFLLSTVSQGNTYAFDQAAVAALWPLEPGKTAATSVSAMMQGTPVTFAWSGTVEAIEEITVAAGVAPAARIRHTLEAPGLFTIETVTWLEANQGFPLLTEVELRMAGQEPMLVTLELKEVR